MSGNTRTSRWSDRRSWLVALFIAATAHAGLYQQFSNVTTAPRLIDAPPVVTVSLTAMMAPVVEPVPEPAPVTPTPPAPVVEAPPRPRPARKARPKPAPVQPVVAPVERTLPAVATAPVESRPVAVELPVVLPRADAAYLRNPPPVYPRRMLRRGVEGTVMVRAQVLEDGSCHHVKLKSSSGHAMLDAAALKAVKGWQFVPARKGDETIVAWVDVPIDFRITRTQ